MIIIYDFMQEITPPRYKKFSKCDNEYANEYAETTRNQMQLLRKTQQVKQMFLEANIKQTGYNKFQKYHYFTLKDMIPHVVKFCNDLELATKFEFSNKCGKLKVFDLETGYYETWTTPLPEPHSSKSGEHCKEIQAIQTYSRRALYLQWLEIVEVNTIELIQPQNTHTRKNKPKHTSKTIENIAYEIKKQLQKEGKPYNMNYIIPKAKEILGEESEEYKDLIKSFNDMVLS